MINNAPINSKKYNQGIYYPNNQDKVIKLNNKGGLYYRSGLEHKMMVYLDMNDDIIFWGAENIKVPYEKTEWLSDEQRFKTTEHCYYPDFYYEMRLSDSSIKRVVAEVKPYSETVSPQLPKNPTSKQLKNFEYSLKMYNKNLSKWKSMLEFCQIKGFEFIILTEKVLVGK